MNAEKPPVAYNVDHEKIAKSKAIVSHWQDLEGEFKPLYRINPLYLGYITEHSGGLFGKKILGVGYGGGILTGGMARGGATVTGLNMSFESPQVTKLHALGNGIQIEYTQETVEGHAEKHARRYDVITCMEIPEHVSNPRSVVRVCTRLVKPGGEVFFSTLNHNDKSWLVAVAGAEYILRTVPEDTHDMKKFIKPAGLLEWVNQTVLKERHIADLHYNPIINIFEFGPSVDVNYMAYTTAEVD